MLVSLKTLLHSIVDYAGLYPPAQLDLRSAMQTYAQSAASPDAWMLSRFVLPAARLREFSALLPELSQPLSSLSRWSLSVVVQDFAEVEQILALQTSTLKIAALEFTPRLLRRENGEASPTNIDFLASQLPPDIDAFFEIPLDQSSLDPSSKETIALLKGTIASAKVRTGGVTESAFPRSRSLAEWIYTCAQAKIPFKATAGLHHPLPGTYPLTYEIDSPIARMHGFLNVAIAAAFAYHQAIELEEIIQLLEINSLTDALQFQDDKLIWNRPQGKRQLNLSEIQTARQHFFRSFGSCSFQEPIDDLRKLGLIDD